MHTYNTCIHRIIKEFILPRTQVQKKKFSSQRRGIYIYIYVDIRQNPKIIQFPPENFDPQYENSIHSMWKTPQKNSTQKEVNS